MNCPVCGSKMVDGKVCKYCGVTNTQVLNASNLKAKEAFKNGQKDKVCYTTNLPSDVNKTKLVVLTITLGLVGAGNFYVGKKIKGLFCAISFGLGILFSVLSYMCEKFSWGQDGLINGFLSIMSLFLVFVFLFWVFDIFNLLFKNYKVPVVLPEEETNMKVIKRGR